MKDLWRGSTKRRNYVFSRERLVEGVHKEKKLCVLSGKTCGGGPQREETVFSRERLVEGIHKEKKLCVLSGKTCGGGPQREETVFSRERLVEGVHKEKKLCVLSGKTCGGGPQREETMCSLGKDLWRGYTKGRNYVFSRERLVEGVHKGKKLCVLSEIKIHLNN